MGFFPEAQAAAVKGNRLQAAFLVKAEFDSATMFLWNGNGVRTFGGDDYQGLRGLGSITGIEQAINGVAPQATFTIEGVSSQAATEAESDPTEYYNKPITLYMQFFNEDWTPLDNPFALWVGLMQVVQTTDTGDAKGGWTVSLGVAAETLFIGRGRPPYSYYSARDQIIRFPSTTDLGFQFMQELQEELFPVPWR